VRKQNQEETRKAIVKILRMKGRPQRQTDLANALGLADSTISYHLKPLEEEGVIAVDKRKFYMLAAEGDVEETILSVFKEHGPFEKGDLFKLEELKVFGAKIRAAYQNLITKGLLVEQDEKIKLTRWGTERLNVCYVCYKAVTGLSVANFVTEHMMHRYEDGSSAGAEIITDVVIHPECFRKIANEQLEEWGGPFIPDKCFCDYCGLPLGVDFYRMLIENTQYVSLDELSRHMLQFENETVRKKKLRFSSMGRCGTEELVAEFEKEAKKMKRNYDSARREQELYNAYREIIKEKKDRMERIIRAFYSPIERAYSSVATPDLMETVTTTESNPDAKPDTLEYVPHKGEYTIIFIGSDGKRLHPYCARAICAARPKAIQ